MSTHLELHTTVLIRKILLVSLIPQVVRGISLFNSGLPPRRGTARGRSKPALQARRLRLPQLPGACRGGGRAAGSLREHPRSASAGQPGSGTRSLLPRSWCAFLPVLLFQLHHQRVLIAFPHLTQSPSQDAL